MDTLYGICEYLLCDKGLEYESSKILINNIFFLSIYGKNRFVCKSTLPVTADADGIHIERIACIYKNLSFNKIVILPHNIKKTVNEYYELVMQQNCFEVLLSANHSTNFYLCYTKENKKINDCYSEAQRLEELLRHEVTEFDELENFRNVMLEKGKTDYLNYTHKQLFIFREELISLKRFYELKNNTL